MMFGDFTSWEYIQNEYTYIRRLSREENENIHIFIYYYRKITINTRVEKTM